MNKLENTPENKARFFAQYFDQRVLREEKSNGLYKVALVVRSFIDEEYLELIPISKINDDDANYVCDIIGFKEQPLMVNKMFVGNYFENQYGLDKKFSHTFDVMQVFDYLRSKGYAVPFMGLSVEDLVEYGWVKLKGGEDEKAIQ